jgi:GDPmannose 4,6-dehydratase
MRKTKKALILGITGQDGAYLTNFLLKKGYKVEGITRNLSKKNLYRLEKLNLLDKINLKKLNNKDKKKLSSLISYFKPDEIYNLSGLSSVYQSFKEPYEAYLSNFVPVLNILEIIKNSSRNIKFYNSASGEIFGNTNEVVDENTIPKPLSPYGYSKLASFNLIKSYRESYSLSAFSGLAFNHESVLRGESFVTKKILSVAVEIFHGKKTSLKLGNINIERDWGWAPEYVEAMWLIMQQKSPLDIILSTGKTMPLSFFISEVFSKLNLSWEDHVKYDDSLKRPSELFRIKTKPSLAKKILGWEAEYYLSSLIDKLLEEELRDKKI